MCRKMLACTVPPRPGLDGTGQAQVKMPHAAKRQSQPSVARFVSPCLTITRLDSLDHQS
jgi:hypothetical protein